MTPNLAARFVCFTALAAAAVATAQVSNTGPTNGSVLDNGLGEALVVSRVLAAPRIDPSTPQARDVAVHWRFNNFALNNDFREQIAVFQNGAIALVIEEGLTSPRDENGAPLNSDGDSFPEVFGGAAYATSRALFGSGLFDSPYLSGFDSAIDAVEFHTFGGLTINGGRLGATPSIAFFAGIVNPSMITGFTKADPPTIVNEPFDPMLEGSKARPLRRGIWSTAGAGGVPVLRALELDDSRPAPIDPKFAVGGGDPFAGQRFLRLHPSDYDTNMLQPEQGVDTGSLFAEQRFSRISNLALNGAGALAFRGDIGSAAIPRLGIWADQISPLGARTLHRVFVEDDARSIIFDSTGSNDPASFYRIVGLGAPAFSDSASEPLVASYAVLRVQIGSTIVRPSASAIIARRPGADLANPSGYAPKILAIENEPFNLVGTLGTFTFVNSVFRTESAPELKNFGLPGLADVAERMIEVGNWRQTFKDQGQESDPSAMIYKPRPSINKWNWIAFLGRIHTENGALITATDPVTGSLLDEGVFTTRGVVGAAEFDRIVFEGDPAPVVRNGVALTHTRFSLPDPVEIFLGYDRQAFHRPVINNRGQILFIANWLRDPPGAPEDREFGRSLFLAHLDGTLQCVATSGDRLGQMIVGPDGASEDVLLTADFCPVPNGMLGSSDPAAREQASLSDCGVVAFTTRMETESSGANRGWGLFMVNTADPRPLVGEPALGPQLVVKSGEFFDLSDSSRVLLTGGENTFFPESISYGFGDPEGGDAALHADGSTAFAINPDSDPNRGSIILARQTVEDPDGLGPERSALDYDGDGILDGCDCTPLAPNPTQTDEDGDGVPDLCDNCPDAFNPDQSDLDGDGIGDVCEGGGDPGCTDCLMCIAEDCPFEGLLLGAGPDFDQSGLVDDTDVTLMLRAMGLPGGRFDMNKDGMVGEKDLVMLMDNYGKTVSKESGGTK